MEPKVGDRIPGMQYDTLMPKDIEPYLNGRSWENLKVGDEIAFPIIGGQSDKGGRGGKGGVIGRVKRSKGGKGVKGDTVIICTY